MTEDTKPAAPDAKPKGPKTMLVVATKQGYYVSRRIRKGQKFVLYERSGFRKNVAGTKKKKIILSCADQFSPNWMVKASDYKPAPEEAPIVAKPVNQGPSGDEAVIQ